MQNMRFYVIFIARFRVFVGIYVWVLILYLIVMKHAYSTLISLSNSHYGEMLHSMANESLLCLTYYIH